MLVLFFSADVRRRLLKYACLSVRPFVEDMSGNFVGATFQPLFFTIQMRMWRGNIVNFSLFFIFFTFEFLAIGYSVSATHRTVYRSF